MACALPASSAKISSGSCGCELLAHRTHKRNFRTTKTRHHQISTDTTGSHEKAVKMPKEVRDIKEVRLGNSCQGFEVRKLTGESTSSSRSLDGTTLRVRPVESNEWEIKIADGRHCVALRIKKTKKNQQTKFKIRAKRFVYTLVLKDASRAEKLTQSMPPSTSISWFGSGRGWRPETNIQTHRPAKDLYRQEEQEGQGFVLRRVSRETSCEVEL